MEDGRDLVRVLITVLEHPGMQPFSYVRPEGVLQRLVATRSDKVEGDSDVCGDEAHDGRLATALYRPRMRSMLRWGTLAAVTMASLIVVGPADAQVWYTSTGVRCTKVGTTGPDSLYGSSSRDVICGRGGDDVIFGAAGRDLIDAGAGNDQVYGGGGDDRILGGYGHDDLVGEGGADVVKGGPQGDDLYGDRLDQVFGGYGDDFCRGNPALLRSCNDDKSTPTVVSLTVSKPTVDLSGGPSSIAVTAHVRDDGGAAGMWVQFTHPVGVRDLFLVNMNGARLVSGTMHDGLWRVRVALPAYTVAGSWDLDATVEGRLGPVANVEKPAALTIVNPHQDLEHPVLVSLDAPTLETTVSVGQSLVTTAHLTDDVSGVGEVLYCAGRVGQNGRSCTSAELVSGTAKDGVWQGTMSGFDAAGDWDLHVLVLDSATRMSFYLPPATCADVCGHEFHHPIPDGRGTFTVVP